MGILGRVPTPPVLSLSIGAPRAVAGDGGGEKRGKGKQPRGTGEREHGRIPGERSDIYRLH